ECRGTLVHPRILPSRPASVVDPARTRKAPGVGPSPSSRRAPIFPKMQPRSPGSREQFRIGHAVAASLFVGLAAALLCALGLFGGAQENVIAGVVLLSFAAGWALLAAL